MLILTFGLPSSLSASISNKAVFLASKPYFSDSCSEEVSLDSVTLGVKMVTLKGYGYPEFSFITRRDGGFLPHFCCSGAHTLDHFFPRLLWLGSSRLTHSGWLTSGWGSHSPSHQHSSCSLSMWASCGKETL